MAIVFDVASTHQGFAAFRQWVHTVGVGDERILIVGGTTNGAAPTGATYNGVAMTLIANFNNPGGAQCSMWYMVAPPEGAHNVRVDFGGNGQLTTGAVSYFGVDPDEPLGTHNTANADSANPSVAVAAKDDELVVDFMGFFVGSTDMTAGALQTPRVDNNSGVGGTGAGMSEEAGAASVTMSWTLTNVGQWAICGVPLRPYIELFGRLVEYTFDVWDPLQRLIGRDGHEVQPNEVRANRWGKLLGFRSPSSKVFSSLADSPDAFYISGVTSDGEKVRITPDEKQFADMILKRITRG